MYYNDNEDLNCYAGFLEIHLVEKRLRRRLSRLLSRHESLNPLVKTLDFFIAVSLD